MSQKILEQLVQNWQNNLSANSEAIKALRDLRGIERIKDLDLGLVKVPAAHELPANLTEALKSFGILNPDLNGMIALPLRTKDHRITNFLMLSVNGRDASTLLGTGDRILRKGGLINAKAFGAFKQIIAVDTIEDFFVYFQHVKENVVPIIQTGEMMTDFARALRDSNTEELILLKSSPYWEYVKAKVYDAEVDIKLYEIKLPGNISVRESLRGNSVNKLKAYIEAEKARALRLELAKRCIEPVEMQKERELETKPEEAKPPAEAEASAEPEALKTANSKTENPEGESFELEDELPRLQIIEEPGELRFTAIDRLYRVSAGLRKTALKR